MPREARYDVMKHALTNLLHDFRILSGEIIGPSDSSWQDVAATARINAQALADQLAEAQCGNTESFLTFPSPSECLEESHN